MLSVQHKNGQARAGHEIAYLAPLLPATAEGTLGSSEKEPANDCDANDELLLDEENDSAADRDATASPDADGRDATLSENDIF